MSFLETSVRDEQLKKDRKLAFQSIRPKRDNMFVLF